MMALRLPLVVAALAPVLTAQGDPPVEPLSPAGVPFVRDPQGWVRNGVDSFVLAERLERGVLPGPEAERGELILRLTTELIGRPPTPEEEAAFLADESPGAYERLLDELLESPEYGAVWAARWSALAGLTDSADPRSLLYDDWVARVMTSMMYDDFIFWNLAGDQIPDLGDDRNGHDQTFANGFLARASDRSTAVLRAVLGVDALPAADAAGLAAILDCPKVREVDVPTDEELFARQQWDARVDALGGEEADLLARAEAGLQPVWRAHLAEYLLAGTAAGRGALFLEAEDASRGTLAPADGGLVGSAGAEPWWVEFDLTATEISAWQVEVRHASAQARPVRVLLEGVEVASAALAGATGDDGPDGLSWDRVGSAVLRPGRNVLRLEGGGPSPSLDRLVLVPLAAQDAVREWPADVPAARGLAPAVVRRWAVHLHRARRGGDPLLRPWFAYAGLPAQGFAAESVARTDELRAQRDAGEEVGTATFASLLDSAPPTSLGEFAGRYRAVLSAMDAAARAREARVPDAALSGEERMARTLLYGAEGPFGLPLLELEAMYPPDLLEALRAIRAQLAELRLAGRPAYTTFFTVRDGEPVEGRAVPRIAEAAVPTPVIPNSSSGRLELAVWAADPAQPLTSRALVRRVWSAHFAESDPIPEDLLDWLARDLQTLQQVQRRVLESATYRAGR